MQKKVYTKVCFLDVSHTRKRSRALLRLRPARLHPALIDDNTAVDPSLSSARYTRASFATTVQLHCDTITGVEENTKTLSQIQCGLPTSLTT